MNKETKSKCCNVPSNYSQIPELCCACGKPFIPQEDTPVTPIEEKKLRYQINKIRNGCWRLEWEDGSFSEHSTQDGAERMRMQIETSRASHPIEPSWEKLRDSIVNDIHNLVSSEYSRGSEEAKGAFRRDGGSKMVQEIALRRVIERIYEYTKAAEEKARMEIEDKFCGEMHLIRESAAKNQLKLIAEIMKKFRQSLQAK